jgi:hypothetical protein
MQSVRFLQGLGYLGLLPFILLTLLTFFPIWPELDALTMFQRYSAIILGFMAGVLWPVWAQQASVRPLALFAVSLPVLSFLAGLLPASYTLAIELLLFIALRLGERWFALDEQSADLGGGGLSSVDVVAVAALVVSSSCPSGFDCITG